MKTLKKWLLFFLLIIVFTSGCSKSTTEDNGKKIIKDFFSNSYEYTATYNRTHEANKKSKLCVYEGMLIPNPYQQYENLIEDSSHSTSLLASYSYTSNNVTYRRMKLRNENDTFWTAEQISERQDAIYNRQNLVLRLKKKEKNLATFYTEYTDTLHYDPDGRNIEVPYINQLEYIVDLKEQEIKKIVINTEESEKAVAIASLMQNGFSKDEAESNVVLGKDYFHSEIIFEITKVNNDLDIPTPIQ